VAFRTKEATSNFDAPPSRAAIFKCYPTAGIFHFIGQFGTRSIRKPHVYTRNAGFDAGWAAGHQDMLGHQRSNVGFRLVISFIFPNTEPVWRASCMAQSRQITQMILQQSGRRKTGPHIRVSSLFLLVYSAHGKHLIRSALTRCTGPCLSSRGCASAGGNMQPESHPE
jgi:hypothetical protein